MTVTTGIFFAFVAMFCWGIGDFLIQKTSRKIGDWETLFTVSFVGSLMLAPFVWKGLVDVVVGKDILTMLILAGCGLVFLLGSLLDFESLKVGKISVVESVWSAEIVVSALLAYFILSEGLNMQQIALVTTLIVGLIMVSIKDKIGFSIRKLFLEKGVFVAFCAAIAMGIANFMVGLGARASDPVVIYFFISVVCLVFSVCYLLYNNLLHKTVIDIKNNPKLILSMSVMDNIAWIAFAFAMSLAPIGIVVALSESYIIISVILGITVSKEKLKTHQKIGLLLALFGALTLAIITV
ncbi:MAG: DMT family transporter [Patescibacteria group bacterium]